MHHHRREGRNGCQGRPRLIHGAAIRFETRAIAEMLVGAKLLLIDGAETARLNRVRKNQNHLRRIIKKRLIGTSKQAAEKCMSFRRTALWSRFLSHAPARFFSLAVTFRLRQTHYCLGYYTAAGSRRCKRLRFNAATAN